MPAKLPSGKEGMEGLEALCESVRTDRSKAAVLEELIDRFGKKILKLAYYYVRNESDSEDIMQEVFLRVYQNLDDFRKSSSYFTWIYRITVNLCKDYLEREKHRQALSLSEEACREAQQQETELAEGGEVFGAVMQLPLKYRTALACYYFEDMSVNQIAKAMNLTECNVRARLSRGRRLLKNLLEAKGVEL